MRHWEIIADKLSKAGWSWGCVATVDAHGRTIFVADALRGDGRHFVVHADEKLSAFIELERQVLSAAPNQVVFAEYDHALTHSRFGISDHVRSLDEIVRY